MHERARGTTTRSDGARAPPAATNAGRLLAPRAGHVGPPDRGAGEDEKGIGEVNGRTEDELLGTSTHHISIVVSSASKPRRVTDPERDLVLAPRIPNEEV